MLIKCESICSSGNSSVWSNWYSCFRDVWENTRTKSQKRSRGQYQLLQGRERGMIPHGFASAGHFSTTTGKHGRIVSLLGLFLRKDCQKSWFQLNSQKKLHLQQKRIKYSRPRLIQINILAKFSLNIAGFWIVHLLLHQLCGRKCFFFEFWQDSVMRGDFEWRHFELVRSYNHGLLSQLNTDETKLNSRLFSLWDCLNKTELRKTSARGRPGKQPVPLVVTVRFQWEWSTATDPRSCDALYITENIQNLRLLRARKQSFKFCMFSCISLGTSLQFLTHLDSILESCFLSHFTGGCSFWDLFSTVGYGLWSQPQGSLKSDHLAVLQAMYSLFPSWG